MTTKEIAEASGKDINIVRKVLKEKGAEMKRGRVPQDFNKKMTDSVLKALEKVAPPGKRGRPARVKDEVDTKPKASKKVTKVEEKPKAKVTKKAEPKKTEVKEKAKVSKPKAEPKKKAAKPKKTMPLDEDEEEDDIVVPSIHDGVPDPDIDDEDDLVDMDSLSDDDEDDDDCDDEDDEEE